MGRRSLRFIAVVMGLLLWLSEPAGADAVVAADTVRSHVVVRAKPSRGGYRIGALRPGERAAYLGAADGWRRVKLADGQAGFVSARWTDVVPDTRPVQQLAKPRRSWSRMFRGSRKGREHASAVEVVIRDPAATTYRSEDPVLPVAGFARLANGAHLHDIVLALDLSTSTNEHSMADVNGDGTVDDGFKGPDSIFAAQVRAAQAFVSALGDLPHNARGERIRVGIVTYGGEERFHLDEDDRELRLEDESLYRLAQRDAKLLSALTHDYASIDRKLVALAKRTPVGMTNAAAGVTRALIELQGLSVHGSESSPRSAQKVILFLTDGKPRLPFDRDKAEAAALRAGRMAQAAGVRINAFTLGRNRVTRKNNDAVRRMATRSGGVHRQLVTPGKIVKALEATPFSVVDRVRIANRTTDSETPPVATGIDGSFYSEVGVIEGRNDIEVVVHLSDGREEKRVFSVDYVEGRPARAIALELERVRRDNRALIDKIKGKLALEIAEARKRQLQRKQLEIEGAARKPWPASRD